MVFSLSLNFKSMKNNSILYPFPLILSLFEICDKENIYAKFNLLKKYRNKNMLKMKNEIGDIKFYDSILTFH